NHTRVEIAARSPPELNLRGDATKYLCKRAIKGLVPDAVLEWPKHGFAAPVGPWFRGALGGLVRDVLLSETARRRGILDTARVERLIANHGRGRELDLQLWTLVSFELWCRAF